MSCCGRSIEDLWESALSQGVYENGFQNALECPVGGFLALALDSGPGGLGIRDRDDRMQSSLDSGKMLRGEDSGKNAKFRDKKAVWDLTLSHFGTLFKRKCLKILRFRWCRRWDLNPHELALTRP